MVVANKYRLRFWNFRMLSGRSLKVLISSECRLERPHIKDLNIS